MKCLQFSGMYDLQWQSLISLYQELEIQRYAVYKQESKKGHKSSVINIQNIDEIKKLIQYLKQSDIGLTRKTERMNEFLEKY